MLDHLRQRVVEALLPIRSATLSTYGPAALQASRLPCESAGVRLYMLVPAMSDHLLNLEHQPEVVVTNTEWQLRGTAVVLTPDDYPPALNLLQLPEAQWNVLIEIRPSQLNIHHQEGWGRSETIDVEP
jgi:hypothetical protein